MISFLDYMKQCQFLVKSPQGLSWGILGKIQQVSEINDIVFAKQVHGTAVVQVTKSTPTLNVEADALVTTEKNLRIGIKTADCLSLIFFDSQKTVAGVIHAGWKGLFGGIIENTVKELRKITKNELRVIIGPSIGPRAFEVRSDVSQKFWELDLDFNLKSLAISIWNQEFSYLDLQMIALAKLHQQNILAKDIQVIRSCTFENPNLWWSHRYALKHTGQKPSGSNISYILI